MRVYGITEIAQEINIRPGTVSQWSRRGKLPEPDARLATGPVWVGRRIEKWIEEQTRKDPPPKRGARASS